MLAQKASACPAGVLGKHCPRRLKNKTNKEKKTNSISSSGYLRLAPKVSQKFKKTRIPEYQLHTNSQAMMH